MQKIEITTHHSDDQLGLFYWAASRTALAPFSLSLPGGFVRLSFPGYHGGAALSHALLFFARYLSRNLHGAAHVVHENLTVR